MLQIQETSGEFVSQDTPITMNRGSKEIDIQGNWSVNKSGDSRRDWIRIYKDKDNDDLEEAGFNEDYEYVDIEAGKNKGYGGKYEDPEEMEDNINGNRNNN